MMIAIYVILKKICNLFSVVVVLFINQEKKLYADAAIENLCTRTYFSDSMLHK